MMLLLLVDDFFASKNPLTKKFFLKINR
jgi:hypothetical protein